MLHYPKHPSLAAAIRVDSVRSWASSENTVRSIQGTALVLLNVLCAQSSSPMQIDRPSQAPECRLWYRPAKAHADCEANILCRCGPCPKLHAICIRSPKP